jgi:hypothetical protein
MQLSEMSATSILSLFETTKSQRQSFKEQVIEAVLSGNAKPLDVQLNIKTNEEIMKSILADERFESAVMDEASRYPGKSFSHHNATFQVRDGKPSYDWSACEDLELDRLQAEFDKAKAALEERQRFLKNAPASGIETIYEDQLITVYPPAKSAPTIIAVTLK